MSNARVLADRLAVLLDAERDGMADFLVALAEFDRRRAWEDLGYSSLFWFLHRELKLSKGAALYRKVAAELVEAHPEVLVPLRDGRLCLTTVFEVSKVLTTENAANVLSRFFHLSRREAAEVAASLRPVEGPAVREIVTRVPVASSPATWAAAPRDMDVTVQPVERDPRDASRRPPPPSAETVPLDADLRRLHVTVTKRFLAKLDAARDALSHSHPLAGTETVLEVGLDLVLARHRERRGVGAKPAAIPRRAAPERMTADVRRRVWERDAGRCQWPLEGGGICGSSLRLEFDHKVPRALGGSPDAANVRLLCRFHNQRAARAVFGDELMDRFTVRTSEPAAHYAAA